MQQAVLEEAAQDKSFWTRRNTRDAEKKLKDVHDELCKAFAVGLMTATTEVCLWPALHWHLTTCARMHGCDTRPVCQLEHSP